MDHSLEFVRVNFFVLSKLTMTNRPSKRHEHERNQWYDYRLHAKLGLSWRAR